MNAPILLGSPGHAGDHGCALVIEPTPADGAMLETVLSARGYEVINVEPEPGLDWATRLQPKLIVLSADVKNGFHLCLKFRKDPMLRRVPLVLTSAKASDDTLRKHRMLPTRADAYLRKPLTETAILKALVEVLPEEFGGPAEDDIGEIPDRTMVSHGVVESAVVTYVEEEVRTLKDVVTRLQSEKAQLNNKLSTLEDELRNEQTRLGSGLQELLLHRDKAVNAEAEATREDARREGWRDGMREGREAGRREGIEEGRRQGVEEGRRQGYEDGRREGFEEGRKIGTAEARDEAERTAGTALAEETETLRLRLAEAETSKAAAVEGEEAARRELLETTLLFERLEAGYKGSVEAAQAERTEFEEKAGNLEAELETLRESLAAADEAKKEVETLRQAAARVEMIEEECRQVRADLEQAKAEAEQARTALEQVAVERDEASKRAAAAVEMQLRVTTLEAALGRAGQDLVMAKTDAEAARSEMLRLREKLLQLRSLLGDDGSNHG